MKSLHASSVDSLLNFVHNSSDHSTPLLIRKPLHDNGERKNVRFADNLEQTVSTISRDDLSKEEIESYWLNRVEMWDIECEKERIVEMIDYSLPKEKGTSYRGLEIHSGGGIFRKKIIDRHFNAVFFTQEAQKQKQKEHCDEELARSCEETSKESLRLARQFGLKDQKDAQKFLCRA
ncbi:unnamed protein product [Cylindrotheca closterium]|uniref:Uncharacterized protein n=1 Tax=Cylindrotheca closterium TaxID=2856 RepID=A0AAD2CPN6_9STRA|nr:unnamed protein product [Cylindrotheca closterium]